MLFLGPCNHLLQMLNPSDLYLLVIIPCRRCTIPPTVLLQQQCTLPNRQLRLELQASNC